MDIILKESLWKQFGASIDMMENALELCPEKMWDNDAKFWFIAFDCLYYLDYYLTLEPEKFVLPAPFGFSDAGTNEERPERVYTKEELLHYLRASRTKCHQLISGMTQELAQNYWTNLSKTVRYSVFELLLYNMRHLQHHTGQLNLLLRQGIDDAPEWISQTNSAL